MNILNNLIAFAFVMIPFIIIGIFAWHQIKLAKAQRERHKRELAEYNELIRLALAAAHEEKKRHGIQ